MTTPPLSLSQSPDGLANVHLRTLSSGPSTPITSSRPRDSICFLHHAFDSDDDGDDDDEDDDNDHANVFMHLETRRRRRKNLAFGPIIAASSVEHVSPSRFVVKGTVTPSRAAPLFARFTKDKRAAKRLKRKDWSESDDSEGDQDENADAPFRASTSKIRTPASHATMNRYPLQPRSPSQRWDGLYSTKHFEGTDAVVPQPPASHFITASSRTTLPPLMPVPIPALHRHKVATLNVSSYMHAMRSNNLGHLSYASSARGSLMMSSGRGVLGVSRQLGAGGGIGSASSVSHRPFHQTFQNTSQPSVDLFTLPSGNADRHFSQPLCAEYANSSRCLSGTKLQWLAVGSNEGQLYLLDTREPAIDQFDRSTPSWAAHSGSIFEVRWRSDDEMIATGGSDYCIRLWDTTSGEEVRTFNGHRGTPRSIAWDPASNGHILSSAGRDGAIHVFDARVKSRSLPPSRNEGESDAVASLWGAHAYEPPRPLRGPGSRGGRRHTHGREAPPKGVTSLAYVPGAGSSVLCSAGCGDGVLKMWDLRAMASYGQMDVTLSDREKKSKDDLRPVQEGPDVSMQFRRNKSPHGISSIVASSTKVFAACTDGCIYTLSAASLVTPHTNSLGLPTMPLFDAAQRCNTLYARLALHEDERTLALGCNSGTITVWDTHAAGLAAAELASIGVDVASVRSTRTTTKTTTTDNRPAASMYSEGREDLNLMARPTVLRRGHQKDLEINGISWAHGSSGPTLASISDDHTIRTWAACPADTVAEEDVDRC